MAKRVQVKMNPAGARALLNSPEVQAHILDYALDVQARTGAPGLYPADVQAGKTRAHALVKTSDLESMRHNARTNALLRGIGGAAGLVEYTSKAGRTSWITQKQADNYSRRRKS